LPIHPTTDSRVKVSSENVPAGAFADNFFGLVGHYLWTEPRNSPVPVDGLSRPLLAPSPILDPPDLTPTPGAQKETGSRANAGTRQCNGLGPQRKARREPDRRL